MKRREFLCILVFLLGLCISITDAIGQEPGKIKESKPAYGNLALELEEETVIRESNENSDYRFSFIKDLAVNRARNLIVIDKDRVLEYDSRGHFMRPIGRKGQGPGEYMQPQSLFVDEHGDLYINDQGSLLHVFDKDGTFRRRIRLAFQIPFDSNTFYVDSEGSIYAFSWDVVNMEMKKVLVKTDASGTVVLRMKTTDDPAVKVLGSPQGGVMGGVIHPYSSNSLFCPVENTMLCYGENIQYRLILCDFSGNVKSVIDRDENPQPISSKEKGILGKSSIFPSHRPFFKKLMSDDQGRIYVIRMQSVLEKDTTEKADIFSKHGRFLYRTEFPALPMVIKNESVYFIDEDREDLRLIKRAKIKNYQTIRVE